MGQYSRIGGPKFDFIDDTAWPAYADISWLNGDITRAHILAFIRCTENKLYRYLTLAQISKVKIECIRIDSNNILSYFFFCINLFQLCAEYYKVFSFQRLQIN